MKKCLILLSALLLFAAFAEDRPGGAMRAMYRAQYDIDLLSGWEVTAYIADVDLILSAAGDDADISVSLESKWNEEAYLQALTRRANLTTSASVSIGEWRRLYAEYISARGAGEAGISCVYTRRLGDMYCIAAINARGDAAEKALNMFETGFIPSLKLLKLAATDCYIAQLEELESDEGVIQLGLDFVELDYDSEYESVIFINNEDKAYFFKLNPEALIYLPDVEGEVYRQKLTGCDAEAIAYVIREYRGINGMDALYLVQFDQANQIIRLQHYNAL